MLKFVSPELYQASPHPAPEITQLKTNFMGQPWDTTSHIFSQILGHTNLKFTLSLISGHWVYVMLVMSSCNHILTGGLRNFFLPSHLLFCLLKIRHRSPLNVYIFSVSEPIMKLLKYIKVKTLRIFLVYANRHNSCYS